MATKKEKGGYPFSRPVVIDRSKLTIPDMRTMASAAFAIPRPDNEQDEAAMLAFMQAASDRTIRIIDMLDRLVVGGTEGRPSDELWPLVIEVTRQINEPQKNSETGSSTISG